MVEDEAPLWFREDVSENGGVHPAGAERRRRNRPL